MPSDATLRIFLRDENGILLTGHTQPNALYLTIDGIARFDLTKNFRYEPGSYQQGAVEFALPGLSPGPHTIVVSAADNYAQGLLARRNRSTASIDFEVIESGAFTLGRVYNFPNPFNPGRGTTFVLTGLNEDARVVIKIHTVSGAMVRALIGRRRRGPGPGPLGRNRRAGATGWPTGPTPTRSRPRARAAAP